MQKLNNHSVQFKNSQTTKRFIKIHQISFNLNEIQNCKSCFKQAIPLNESWRSNQQEWKYLNLKVTILVGVNSPGAGGEKPDEGEGQVERRKRPIRLVDSDAMRLDDTVGHVHPNEIDYRIDYPFFRSWKEVGNFCALYAAIRINTRFCMFVITWKFQINFLLFLCTNI